MLRRERVISVLVKPRKWCSVNFSYSHVVCRPVSWCAPSSPGSSTFAFWLPSPGCAWRECSSTSCWWRSSRASSHAGSTTTSPATSSPPWSWASQRPSTTWATAHSGRKCTTFCRGSSFAKMEWKKYITRVLLHWDTPAQHVYCGAC